MDKLESSCGLAYFPTLSILVWVHSGNSFLKEEIANMFLVSISSFEIMHSYFQTNWISSFGLELLPTNHFNWRLYLTRVPSKNVFRWVLSFPPCLDFFCYHEFLSSKQIGWAWEHLWISTSSDLPLQFETLFDKFAIQECHNINHSLVVSFSSQFSVFVTM